jgi:hypothetical protein
MLAPSCPTSNQAIPLWALAHLDRLDKWVRLFAGGHDAPKELRELALEDANAMQQEYCAVVGDFLPDREEIHHAARAAKTVRRRKAK